MGDETQQPVIPAPPDIIRSLPPVDLDWCPRCGGTGEVECRDASDPCGPTRYYTDNCSLCGGSGVLAWPKGAA